MSDIIDLLLFCLLCMIRNKYRCLRLETSWLQPPPPPSHNDVSRSKKSIRDVPLTELKITSYPSGQLSPSKMKKWPAKLRTLRSCWPANFWKIRKRIWNIYTNHIPVYIGEKLSQVEGSPSQPSQLYRAFVWQKRLTHLTELTAGRLSSEFTQTFIFLQVLNNWLQHSTQHKFVSSSQTPILAPFFFSITTLVHAPLWVYIWPSCPG